MRLIPLFMILGMTGCGEPRIDSTGAAEVESIEVQLDRRDRPEPESVRSTDPEAIRTMLDLWASKSGRWSMTAIST